MSTLIGQGLETIEQFHHYVAAFENALAGKEGRVGSDALPSSELLRFRSCTHLGFPGKAVEKIVEPNGERSQYELLVGFLGLIGPSGVMQGTLVRECCGKRKREMRPPLIFSTFFITD